MVTTEAVAGLEAAFRRIAATRMAGLPLNNLALQVQAVGFRPQDEGYLIGVLITPWAINLVMLAPTPSRELHLAPDRRRTWDFPSGSYEFMGGEEPECGAYQFCSLFSPAFEFRDQVSAVETAVAIMTALFADTEPDRAGEREAARLAGRPVSQIPTTRRGFLQGVFGGLKG
ncbi:MAG: [NiFe]-hydrogenase assembly chaperone HybE [Rhodocyclales bacterium]|nr:[NiFe]-hydrogenase assembly chaperone HybE [Rhodocyclales bacterium]